MKLLISNGANVNDRSSLGDTPLMIEAKNGHLEVVQLLISRGAKINAKNNYGMTPLLLAVYHNWLNVVQCLDKPWSKHE